MITVKEYKKASSLEEAWELNQKRTNRIIGGMLWVKMSRASINCAIDLSGLGLDKIEETEDAFHIGAMVTLRALETNEGLNSYTNGAVKNALHHIVGVQFRNLATVGGSVWGRFGFSDVITLLLALDTYVELYKGGTVPLNTFLSMPYDNDILVGITVKKENLKIAYETTRLTKTDFPILAVCVSKSEHGCRASIGARPGKAALITDEENILSGDITSEKSDSFASYAAEKASFSSNMRGSGDYRRHLCRVLTKRAIAKINEKGEN